MNSQSMLNPILVVLIYTALPEGGVLVALTVNLSVCQSLSDLQ